MCQENSQDESGKEPAAAGCIYLVSGKTTGRINAIVKQ
jgi:hypothetical protein